MSTFREDIHLGHKVPLVETDDIKDGAITTDKLADSSVTEDKLADDSVTSEKIKDGEVKTPDIADGAVTTEKIADDAVTSEKIKDGEVKTPDIEDGAVTYRKLAEPVQQELIKTPTIIYGDVTNTPDEEDLTTVEIAGAHRLRLKNRSSLNGKGYVILRTGIPLSSQIINADTVYEVRYDFDLEDDTVAIPEDCVLDFKGGSIFNGTLIGNNTSVMAGLMKIFEDDLVFEGTWNIGEAYPEWFGAAGDGVSIDTDAVQATVNAFSRVKLTGSYVVRQPIVISKKLHLSDGTLTYYPYESSDLSDGILKIAPDVENETFPDNVVIDGVHIVGDYEDNPDTNIIGIQAQGVLSNTVVDADGYRGFEHLLDSIIVRNCTISHVKTGISFDVTDGSMITGNTIHDVVRSGISIFSCHNAIITGNVIRDINVDGIESNSYGICVTNHQSETSPYYPPCADVKVDNNVVDNNPYWEAYDTHCGLRVSFTNNNASNVKVGVMVTRDHAGHSAQDCIVANNILKGNNETNYYGVNVIGVPATSQGGDDYVFIEGCIVTNNTISNFYGGVHCYLTSSVRIDSNTIYDCGRGIAWESFQNDTVKNNVIVLDESNSTYSTIGRYGLILNKLSSGPATQGKLYFEGNNIHIKGTPIRSHAPSYAVYSVVDISQSAFYLIGKSNSIRVDRTDAEAGEDLLLGVSRSHRWYGHPELTISDVTYEADSLVYRCFMYVDVLGVFTYSTSSVTTVGADSSMAIATFNEKLFIFQRSLLKPTVQYTRDAIGVVFSVALQGNDGSGNPITEIMATNTTSTNISFNTCNFFVMLNGRPYL